MFNLVDLVKVSIPAMSPQQIQAASAKASLGPAVIVASIRMNVWFRSLLIEWCLIPFPVCKSPHRLYYTVITSLTILAKIKLLLILEGFHCREKIRWSFSHCSWSIEVSSSRGQHTACLWFWNQNASPVSAVYCQSVREPLRAVLCYLECRALLARAGWSGAEKSCVERAAPVQQQGTSAHQPSQPAGHTNLCSVPVWTQSFLAVQGSVE